MTCLLPPSKHFPFKILSTCSFLFYFNPTILFSFLHRDGYACRFPASQLKSRSRKSRGVRAIGLRNGDQVADIDILEAHGNAAGAVVVVAADGKELAFIVYFSTHV